MAEEFETENLQQTNFIDDSVLSLQEADVFPELVTSKNQSERSKQKLEPEKKNNRLLWLAVGLVALMIVIILILLLIVKNQAVIKKIEDENNNLNQNQVELVNQVDDQLYILENLTSNFILPQIKEDITP